MRGGTGHSAQPGNRSSTIGTAAQAQAAPAARARASGSAFASGVVAVLLDHLGVADVTWRPGEAPPHWSHPAKVLEAVSAEAAQRLAVVAELDPGLHGPLGLSGDLASDVAAAEVFLDHVQSAPERGPRYRPLPRYPGIKLDVAVALADATPAEAVREAIEQAGKGSVTDAELFDLYRGASVGEGRKSLAYHVVLQSEKKTLTEKDERKFLSRFEALVEKLGGELRKG